MLTTYKWSISEWHELIESGVIAHKSVQLLEGDIVEMSPEREQHSYTNDDVAQLLRDKLRGLAKIRESHPVTLDNSEPEPDIAIVRLPKTIYLNHHPYPEDIYWLIEVSNKTLNIDLNVKSKTYARNGISEYWVIDLVNRKLVVHTNPNSNREFYTQVANITTGTVSPQAFPDLKIDLNDLFIAVND